MKRRGLTVYAVTSPDEYLQVFAEQEQIPVFGVEMPRQITLLSDLKAIFRLWQHLRRIRPHIVHAHTPKGGLLGMIAAWLARVPIRIYHIHGLPLMTARGYKRILLRWSESLSCRLAHQVLCVSHSVRNTAITERLCPPEKIEVLLKGSINGIDADCRFNPAQVSEAARTMTRKHYEIPEDAPVIGFVGRIVRDKGITELVEAWQSLHDIYPSMHLLVVGPFEPQDPVPTSVEQILRKNPHIHLIGFDWNTPPLYAAMDILILPTYREGLPYVPLEAAAMMLPVVATNISGCKDAVEDGKTGILVPPYDARALAEAIRIYLNDPDLRRQHGKAGRERVLREFRQEAMWEALYNEYAGLMQQKNISVPEGGYNVL